MKPDPKKYFLRLQMGQWSPRGGTKKPTSRHVWILGFCLKQINGLKEDENPEWSSFSGWVKGEYEAGYEKKRKHEVRVWLNKFSSTPFGGRNEGLFVVRMFLFNAHVANIRVGGNANFPSLFIHAGI